jgi:hypothetical protein
MAKCSRCGKESSIFNRDLTSGLCADCRREDAANNPWSLSNLTRAGWLLTLATLVLIGGLAIPYGQWLSQFFPNGLGGNYGAMALLAGPLLLSALAFFKGGTYALGSVNIPIWQRPHDGERP